MSGQTVFVVVLHDRHIDDVITIHASGESMARKVDEYKAGYEGIQADEWIWAPRAFTWRCGDDGPRIRVREMPVLP